MNTENPNAMKKLIEHYKEFSAEWGTVTVHVFSFVYKKWSVRVDWSCSGICSVSEADYFKRALTKALRYARRMEALIKSLDASSKPG